jgi:hypothetical protein
LRGIPLLEGENLEVLSVMPDMGIAQCRYKQHLIVIVLLRAFKIVKRPS